MKDYPENALGFTGTGLKRVLLSVARLTAWLLISVLCTTVNAVAGDVYKWTDQDGNVHYGAQPESSNAQTLNIKVTPSTPSNNEKDEAESGTAAGTDESDGTPSTDSQSASQADIDAKNAEISKKNCEVIKKRLAAIQRGGRLYEMDDNGERQYWDDKTRTSKLDQAQSDVKKWCD